MISLVKYLKCISRLNIHCYPNRRDKSHITSLKAVIVGKSLISAGLDIERIQHFVYDKVLQIYRQYWVSKCYRHILSKYRQISKKRAVITPPARHILDHICFPVEACQTTEMELWAKNIHGFRTSWMFDWVLNTPLQTARHHILTFWKNEAADLLAN